jgi:uncharacterized cupin superfamily protein
MVPEAPLERSEHGGLVPAGPGWFVVNAREAKWMSSDAFGYGTVFEGEGEAGFAQLGINIGVLAPGQPACMYHRENQQEDFLVLYGECLLLVEEQERRLGPWDFVHCPPETNHVFVGAGDGPCAILAVGARLANEEIVYPESELARRHNAGVETETPNPREAYAKYERPVEVPYRDGWLPG